MNTCCLAFHIISYASEENKYTISLTGISLQLETLRFTRTPRQREIHSKSLDCD